jgi:hypothetical protein
LSGGALVGGIAVILIVLCVVLYGVSKNHFEDSMF